MSAPVLPRCAGLVVAGRPLRLVAYGSSTTEGYGASSAAAGYVGWLERLLAPHVPGGLTVINRGVSGETSREMERRLDQVIADAPDLVLWQTGSNDPTAGVRLDDFVARTRHGIARLQDAGAELVLMDQQYSRNLEDCADVPAFRRALRGLAHEAGLPLFRRYDAMRDWIAAGRFSIDTLSPDGTHMNDAGYRLLGETVAAFLLDALGLAPADAFSTRPD